MVTIVAPTSRVIPRGATRLQWSSTYPQSAYEIQFRPARGATAWSTTGRVNSTAKYADWDVSKLADGVEYYWRVVLYATNAASGTTIYSGSDASQAYSIIVTPKSKLAELRVKYGAGMLAVDLVDETTAPEHTRVTLAANRGVTAVLPIVAPAEPDATDLKIEHPIGARCPLKKVEASQLAYSGIPDETYMRKDTHQSSTYYYYDWNNRSYYISNYISSYTRHTGTYNRGNYLSGYSTRYNKTYYRGYYLSSTTYGYRSYIVGTYKSGTAYHYGTYQSGTYITGSYYDCYSVWYSSYGWEFHPTHYECKTFSTHCGLPNAGGWYVCYYDECTQKGYSTSYLDSEGYVYRCSTVNRYAPKYSYYHYGGATYANYYGYYQYSTKVYSRYYGYYRYTSPNYAPYYGYYYYKTPNYSPYYGYYRYYYRDWYNRYWYTTSYHYA